MKAADKWFGARLLANATPVEVLSKETRGDRPMYVAPPLKTFTGPHEDDTGGGRYLPRHLSEQGYYQPHWNNER